MIARLAPLGRAHLAAGRWASKIRLRRQRAGMLQSHQCAIRGSRVWQNHSLSSFEGSTNLVITALMENPAQHIIPTEKQTSQRINKVPLKPNTWLSHKLLMDLCCLSTYLAGSCCSNTMTIYVMNECDEYLYQWYGSMPFLSSAEKHLPPLTFRWVTRAAIRALGCEHCTTQAYLRGFVCPSLERTKGNCPP